MTDLVRAVIVPTVRPDLFRTYLRSFAATPALEGWRLYPVMQDWSPAALATVQAMPEWERVTEPILLAERDAPYILRVTTMAKYPDVDVWCNTDDDMEFLPGETNYDEAVNRALQPGVGVVSCNWIRSEAFRKRAVVQPGKFIKQPIVNMSGGQVYSRRIARLLARNPVQNYKYDDLHTGLVAYIHGNDNFRYLGSLLIHRILKPGGLKQLFNDVDLAVPDPKLLPVSASARREYEADNNTNMPRPEDLTARAHALHRANRAAAMAAR